MARGTLRIYLGAAPGVGKTYAMLNEGHRRAERGSDIVIGFVETHGRCNTASQIGALEVIPRRVVTYRGAELEDMDVDAVLARHPELVLVDELAHTNVPGMRHAKRWQDVDELLAHGIDVISTVNVQHLESLNDVVDKITGVIQRETVPDAFVRSADQVELVDMTPEALRRRLAHGNVYAPDRVDAALANYFRPGNLGALRELALLWVADRVEENLQDYLAGHDITATWETRERVVVALTGAPGGDLLVRRATRIASRRHGEVIGVHISPADGLAARPTGDLERQRALLIELGGTYREVVGDDVAGALATFATAEQATQIVLGASRRSRWEDLVHGSLLSALGRRVQGVDLHVIATAAGAEEPLQLPRLARRSAVPPERERIGFAMCVVGLPTLCWLLVLNHEHLNLSTALLLNLALVIAIAATGGIRPGLVASVLSVGFTNWFLTPPVHTLHINNRDDIVALVIFVAITVVVSVLVDRSARRAREAGRARAEAKALARTSGSIVSSVDPLPDLLDQLRTLFDLDTAMVLDRVESGWTVTSSAGLPAAADPHLGMMRPLDERGEQVLVLVGGDLTGDDHSVLDAFIDQLALGLEARRLRHDAATVDALEQANELRTALLRAVSHDLRTPLASIKASVSGLLEKRVPFSDADRDALLGTIDVAADRLDRVIGNLLDMSRLQAGAMQIDRRPTALEDVVSAALAHLGAPASRVTIDVSETVPLVLTDGALLERAVGNVVSNALAWSPEDRPVRIEAAVVADHVELRVVDRGPGIGRAQRALVFEPFQRLGDRSTDAGAGLGLAIARGFVEATGAKLELDDTPGGGTTITFILPLADVAVA
ncbi:MAG: histidine kinase [Ilumatobacteraceae bacterium]|nr:histidine kinase [Ilumatobacteraceae bacterium]